MARCPILRATELLREEEPHIDAAVAEWRKGFEEEIRELVAEARDLPFPSVDALLDGAYLPTAR